MSLTVDECYSLISNPPRTRMNEAILMYDIYFKKSFLNIIPCLLSRNNKDHIIIDHHCNKLTSAYQSGDWPYFGQEYISIAFLKDKQSIYNFSKKTHSHIKAIIPGLTPEFIRPLFFEQGRKDFLTAGLGFIFLKKLKKIGLTLNLKYVSEEKEKPVLMFCIYDKNPFKKEPKNRRPVATLVLNIWQGHVVPSDTKIQKNIDTTEELKNEITNLISRSFP